MISRINALRAGQGLTQLAPNDALGKAAAVHAADLASGRVNLDDSHIGSDGSTAWGRAVDAGYSGQFVREMTGWGWDGDYGRMMAYWLQSPVHRPIIFDPAANEIGEAYLPAPGSAWGNYWVVIVGRGSGVIAPPPVSPAPAPPVPTGHVVLVPVVAGGREVPPSGAVDLLPYLRGDGRAYMIQHPPSAEHPSGAQEKFRTVNTGDGGFLQLKNNQWEQFWVADEHIWRGVDTSPGDGQFYRQFEDGREGARWCPRYMTIGQSWRAPVQHRVQTYWKGDCSEVDHHRNGRATNGLRLAARHERLSWNGVTVDDVIELHTHTGERMFFGRGWGLVAWSSAWGNSAISHVLPPEQADNEPEQGCFS